VTGLRTQVMGAGFVTPAVLCALPAISPVVKLYGRAAWPGQSWLLGHDQGYTTANDLA